MPAPNDLQSLDNYQHGKLAQAVMRRQAMLSIRVASIFVLLLFGVPLVNYFMPELAATPVLGFTATWLFLGVLFYPITWALSWYFVEQSNKIETECSDWRSLLGVSANEPRQPQSTGDIKHNFGKEE